MSTEALGTVLIAGLLSVIVFVGAFDVGGRMTEALIIAGSGLAVLALLFYWEWRNGSL